MRKIKLLMISIFILNFILFGCSKKLSQEQIQKLEESKAETKAAYEELRDVKAQREVLEKKLELKKKELEKYLKEKKKLLVELGYDTTGVNLETVLAEIEKEEKEILHKQIQTVNDTTKVDSLKTNSASADSNSTSQKEESK